MFSTRRDRAAEALFWVAVFGLAGCSTSGPQRSSTMRLSQPSAQQVVATASNEGLACSVPKFLDRLISAHGDATIAEQFRQACVQHDYCYRHGAPTYGVTRHQCDADLYTHVKALCTQITAEGFSRWGCGLRAALTYAGVRVGGLWSYEKEGYWHDYDAQPSPSKAPQVPRAIRSAGSSSAHLLVLTSRYPAELLETYRWKDEKFVAASRVPIPASSGSALNPFEHSDIPQVVKQGSREVLVYTPSPRLLQDLPAGNQHQWGKGSLWVAAWRPYSEGSAADASVPLPQHVGEEDTQHMPALVDDVNGDGSIEAVYIGRSRTTSASTTCEGSPIDRDDETYISVETVGSDSGCYSISVLDDVPGASGVSSEKYKKFQYPPIVGDFVAEASPDPRRLEILLIYRPAELDGKVTGWLLEQIPCKKQGGVCWQASVVSPKGFVLPAAFHPLAALPAPLAAGQSSDPQLLLGVDWTDADPKKHTEAQVRTLQIAVGRDGPRAYLLRTQSAPGMPYYPRHGRSHSPISIMHHAGSLLGAYSELSLDKRGWTATITTVASRDAVGKLTRREFKCHPGREAAEVAWVKNPQLLGDFDADGSPDVVFVDVAAPERSILFTHRSGRFEPTGASARETCGF